MVVVVDETLLSAVNIRSGLKPGGRIVVNSNHRPALIKEAFQGFEGEIYAVDAADISIRNLGKNLPNTPLLSVVAKLTGIIGEEAFFDVMAGAFQEKFSAKPEVVEGNMKALREAWNGAVLVNGDGQ
jgi:pyruvate ferredoxin oxidoreductase gamma subunit